MLQLLSFLICLLYLLAAMSVAAMFIYRREIVEFFRNIEKELSEMEGK